MKDNFSSSRLRQKTASFRQDSDERQLPFVQIQTKDSFLFFRLRLNTTFFRLDPDKELLLLLQRKKTSSLSPDSDKTYVAKDSTFRPDLNERAQFYGTLLLVENWLYVFYQRSLCVSLLPRQCSATRHYCCAASSGQPNIGRGAHPNISGSKNVKELLRPSMYYFFYMPICVSDIFGGIYAYT